MKNLLLATLLFFAFSSTAQLDTLGLHKRVQDFGQQLFKAVKMNSEYDLVPLIGTKENVLEIMYSKTNRGELSQEQIVEPSEEDLANEWTHHQEEVNACLAKTFTDMRAQGIRVRDITFLDVSSEDVLAGEITEENAKMYDIGVYRVVVRFQFADKTYSVIANDCWNLSGGLIMGYNFMFDANSGAGSGE